MLTQHRGPIVYTLLVLAGGIACALWQAPMWVTALTAIAMMLIADQLERAMARPHRGHRKTARR